MAQPTNDFPKAAKSKVRIMKNGPYLVSGGAPLSVQEMLVDDEGQCHGWKEGEKYPSKENYSICRCGQSKTPPFCDGTHKEVHFDGTEKATHDSYLERCEEIVGPGLKLTDAKDLCARARFCHRAGGHLGADGTI